MDISQAAGGALIMALVSTVFMIVIMISLLLIIVDASESGVTLPVVPPPLPTEVCLCLERKQIRRVPFTSGLDLWECTNPKCKKIYLVDFDDGWRSYNPTTEDDDENY